MTFRLSFQISRVGALCRPTSSDGLVSKLVATNGNLKKCILYHIKRNPFANLLQECKYKTSYVPTRHNSTKSDCEHFIEPNSTNSVKTARPKLDVEDGKTYNHCEKVDEMNLGPNLNPRPSPDTQVHPTLPKYKYGMESHYNKIKDLDNKMRTTEKPIINPSKLDIANIMSDIDLKIQNDIWKQAGSEIMNNLNSKKTIWRFIYGNRKTLWQDLSATKMFTNLVQSNASMKTLARDIKNLSKYQMSLLPQRFNASKIFARDQSKSLNNKIQANNFIKADGTNFSKQNVIMTTVYNRQLNNPSPEFMDQNRYNNSFYDMNEMKDFNSYNDIDLKYSKIYYNAGIGTYVLKKQHPLKPTTSDKKIKPSAKKFVDAKPTQKKKQSFKTTNEGIMKQCSTKSINLEKLNEAIRNKKAKVAKNETPLPKKKDQKVKSKIQSTRLPKTLGQIYGVGKIPFLIEVVQAGQINRKQYLVIIELPESQASSESSTNSPIPLALNAIFERDLEAEAYISEPDNFSKNYETKTMPKSTITSKKDVTKFGKIGLGMVKNKKVQHLKINYNKEFEPLLLTNLSQLIKAKMSKKVNATTTWTEKAYSHYRFNKRVKKVDDQTEIVASLSPPANTQAEYKKTNLQRRIMNSTKFGINERQLKAPMMCKHVRHYCTRSMRNRGTKLLGKVLLEIPHTNCTVKLPQQRYLCCCMVCPCCGRYPCVCSNCCCRYPCVDNNCRPCGWYPGNKCPPCWPKFQLDFCCPRYRWDCSVPVRPCRKIEAPYQSYGECMPTWWKVPTECFNYEQHVLQPKNQVSPVIHLMEESCTKMTVVDPALERKCYRDKWCEPYYPPVDQRICYYTYKVPVDGCCSRGRPHCYCWPDRPCIRKPPPYRCFSDEDLEFPEVEISEHDLARRFASDVYRRMGKKCALPFTPASSVTCDLRTGEPRRVYKHDPKAHRATTCIPQGAYLAPCTPQRIPPCKIPCYDTCINCCMPMEGIKKTRCTKRCVPPDCTNDF